VKNILGQGYIQIYTGDGKGKTTASLGVVLRILGNGGKVFYAQFIKGKKSSEFIPLEKFSDTFTHRMFGTGRFIRSTPSPEDLNIAENGLNECRDALSSGNYDLIVLDELNGALQCGVLQLSEVIETVKMRHSQTELIITGRNAHPELVEIADLVSEIIPVKHYFEKGVISRNGIEQ
jgi:cob(I)alamin adenosyltransferase